MNVVEQWRDRARALRSEFWRCAHCGRMAAVRRAACTGCGEPCTDAALAAAPRKLHALESSHAHVIVETMDQLSGRGTVMLARSDSGQFFAFALCESDAANARALEGVELELVLRRKSDVLGSRDPIVYQRKLAASAETRRARISKKEG